jgi:hypothetical protein
MTAVDAERMRDALSKQSLRLSDNLPPVGALWVFAMKP